MRRQSGFGNFNRFANVPGASKPNFASKMPASVSGIAAVQLLSKALAGMPSDKIDFIREVWNHPNHKRIHLQKVGGSTSKGRGFVIDNRVIVDGLTRRMQRLDCDESAEIISSIARYYREDEWCASVSEKSQELDKKCKKCSNLRKMDPMQHGSSVHVQLYNAVRYALHLSGLHRTKRKLPAKFDVDVCTNECLLAMVRSGLYAFTSEWQVFSTQGTGIATAVDLVALDAKNGYRPVVIEIKTGSAVKAMSGCRYNTLGKFGLTCAAVQTALTKALMAQCYSRLFQHGTTGACILYCRPWGVIRIEVDDDVVSKEDSAALLKVLLRREKSLRSGLSRDNNSQSHLTSKGKPRKRTPREYEVGFEKTHKKNDRAGGHGAAPRDDARGNKND